MTHLGIRQRNPVFSKETRLFRKNRRSSAAEDPGNANRRNFNQSASVDPTAGDR